MYNRISLCKFSKSLGEEKDLWGQGPINKFYVKRSQNCIQYRDWAKSCSVK